MTVVEFLLEKYKSQNTLLFAEDFEQAKEMDKEQHQETFKQSRKANIFEKDMPPVWKTWEEYYNTTFKSE